MGMVKCPRCDLNYKKLEDDYCEVCKKELSGRDHVDEFDICIVCSVKPAVEGEHICASCLKQLEKEQRENVVQPLDEKNDFDSLTDDEPVDEAIPETEIETIELEDLEEFDDEIIEVDLDEEISDELFVSDLDSEDDFEDEIDDI